MMAILSYRGDLEAMANGSSWPASYQLTEFCNPRDLGETNSYVVNVFRNAFMAAGVFRGRSTGFNKSLLGWTIEQRTTEYERRAGNFFFCRVLSDPYKDPLIVRKVA